MKNVVDLFLEGVRQFRRNPGLSFAASAVVGAAVLQGLLAYSVVQGVDQAYWRLRQQFQAVFFLKPDTGTEDLFRLKKSLEGETAVARVEDFRKEEAYDDFQRDPEIRRLLDALGENPFVHSLTVTFNRKAPEDIPAFLERWRKDQAVDEIVYGEELWSSVAKWRQALVFAGVLLGVLWGGAVLLILMKTYQLILLARREDFRLLRRLGAPLGRWKWVLSMEGVLQGLLGSAAALLVLETGFRLIGWREEDQTLGLVFRFFFDERRWSAYVYALAAGMVLSIGGAQLAWRGLRKRLPA